MDSSMDPKFSHGGYAKSTRIEKDHNMSVFGARMRCYLHVKHIPRAKISFAALIAESEATYS